MNEARAAILDVLAELELVKGEQVAAGDLEFAGLNIDSIKIVDLCVGLEEKLGREVSIEELIENPTLNKLADYVSRVDA
jgi:acyl carrier protein